jgi:nucleoside-diphosphate-sugar epimerase
MQPVAITGVTGFIGRHAARALMQQGKPWRGLVRDPGKVKALGLAGGEIIEGHLGDERSLDKLCEGVQALIHCGGSIAGFSPGDFRRVNVEGTAALVSAGQRNGVKRFVHVSSLAAREPKLSSYASSKRESETVLRERGGDLAWVIVRPPAVYGPGDEATIPLMKALTRPIAFIPGAAGSRFSLIHVEDLARALTLLALSENFSGITFEIDDGKTGGYDFGAIAAAASAVTGRKVRVIFLPRPALVVPAWCYLIAKWIKGSPGVFSPEKLAELYHRDWVVDRRFSELPGFRPRIDFSTGFADTLEWYRHHQWLPEGGSVQGPERTRKRGVL